MASVCSSDTQASVTADGHVVADVLARQYISEEADYSQYPSFGEIHKDFGHAIYPRDAAECLATRSNASTAYANEHNARKTRSDPGCPAPRAFDKPHIKRSGRQVTKRGNLEAAFYQSVISHVMIGNEDSNVPEIPAYGGANTLEWSRFVLRASDNIEDFIVYILQNHSLDHSEEEMLEVLRTAFLNGGDSVCSRWFRSLPRFERDRIFGTLNRLIKYLSDERLLIGLPRFLANTPWGEDDYPDDAIMVPDDEPADEEPRWCDTATELLDEEDGDAIGKHLGIDVSANDRELSAEAKSQWHDNTNDNKRLPVRAYGLPNYYGTMPDHVPRAKTAENPHGSWAIARLNEEKLDLPKPIMVKEVLNPERFVTATDKVGNTSIEGKSFPYNPIILIDGVAATFYSDETMAGLGSDENATLSTVFRVEAFPHRVATITVEYLFLCRESRVPLVTVRIPLNAVIDQSDIKKLEASDVRHFFRDMGMNNDQRHPAVRAQFQARTSDIQIFHDRQSQADLTRAGFPDLVHILSHITGLYKPQVIDLDVFVSGKWIDFGFWATTFPDLLVLAHGDPLESIRAGLQNTSVVEPNTINLEISENTVQLPPLSRFSSVDDQLTILSDAFVRDAHYQATIAEAFADQRVKVIMLPLEDMKINVPDPADKSGTRTVVRPSLYHVVVTHCSDMKHLIELCPPPGTLVSCQIDLRTAAVRQPVHQLTVDERCEMLAHQISKSLADAEAMQIRQYTLPERGTPEFEEAKNTPIAQRKQEFRERARFHHAMAAVDPFVQHKDPVGEQTTDQANSIRDQVIIRLTKQMMREWRTEADGRRDKESKPDWTRRIARICGNNLEILQLPALPMDDAPLWLGMILDYDGPLSSLGSIHMVVRVPKVPNWDRQRNGQAPFVFVEETPLPAKTTNADKYTAALGRVLPKIQRSASLQFQVDEKTTKERLKGCKKHEQQKNLAVNEWLAKLTGVPVTLANVTEMIGVLNEIRHHVIQSEIATDFGNGEYDIDNILPDDQLTYPVPETDENGVVNPITTREFQLNRNHAIKAGFKLAIGFDRDQRQAFLDLDKCPFGILLLQGCPGSGKSKVIEFFCCCIWDSELCLVDDMSKHISTVPVEKDEAQALTQVQLITPEYDEAIKWDEPILSYSLSGEDAVEEEFGGEETTPGHIELRQLDVPEPVSFPPLRGGPSGVEVKDILKSLDSSLSGDDFIEDFLTEVYDRFMETWRIQMGAWIQSTFLPLFDKTLSHLPRDLRASLFPSALEENTTRYMSYGKKYYGQWAGSVRSALKHGSDEGYCDSSYYTEKMQTTAAPRGRSVKRSTGEPDIMADTLAQLCADNNEAVPRPKAPVLPVNGKIAFVVNRNSHAERVAGGLGDTYRQMHPDGERNIIKVNNLALETKQLLRDLRGLDRTGFVEDKSLSISAQLNAALGMIDAADYIKAKKAFERKLTGGEYTLGAMVKAMLQSGASPELQDLLDREADPNTPDDLERTKEIEKQLLALYKVILDRAHAVIATPVVMSKLADKGLYSPCLIVFDEAGMTPECDTLLIMNQFPGCRWFALVGDWRQEGIITLSDELRAHSDPMFALYNPPEQKDGRNKGKKKLDEADYRLKADIKAATAPFIRQQRESLLARIDKAATKYVAHTNINHRSLGGLERIASVIGYDSRMESAYHPQDLTDAGIDVHNFVQDKIASIGKLEVRNERMRGSRLTVLMDGTPTISKTSWTNLGQINFALHLASELHKNGVKNDNGELLSVLILTPYAQASRDGNRALREMSPAEICKSRVVFCTIDAAQGAEADFVITIYTVGDRGGFLFHKARVVVALTRARYGAVDVLNEALCMKRNPQWNHFRTYHAIQKENNAIVSTKRDWSKLSNITFTPASDQTRCDDLFCGNCNRPGHHPRNCKAPKTEGLLADGSNIPPEYKTLGKTKPRTVGKLQSAPKTSTQARNKIVLDGDLVKRYEETFAKLDVNSINENDMPDFMQQMAPDARPHEYVPTGPEQERQPEVTDEDLADQFQEECEQAQDREDEGYGRRNARGRRTGGRQLNFRKIYSSAAAQAAADFGDSDVPVPDGNTEEEALSTNEEGTQDWGTTGADTNDWGMADNNQVDENAAEQEHVDDDASSASDVESDAPTDDAKSQNRGEPGSDWEPAPTGQAASNSAPEQTWGSAPEQTWGSAPEQTWGSVPQESSDSVPRDSWGSTTHDPWTTKPQQPATLIEKDPNAEPQPALNKADPQFWESQLKYPDNKQPQQPTKLTEKDQDPVTVKVEDEHAQPLSPNAMSRKILAARMRELEKDDENDLQGLLEGERPSIHEMLMSKVKLAQPQQPATPTGKDQGPVTAKVDNTAGLRLATSAHFIESLDGKDKKKESGH